ncbi:T1SS-143 repeat domain-containing protein [Photobacterium profundum]|uniref:T1SS-143 repeat domain-containing protein n=1 Tax=Photobacterium profundum TaxID=74109 RepID=UPI000673D770|nr:T1SS-143 repeat domain-containing protein [Photobacterium profundum]
MNEGDLDVAGDGVNPSDTDTTYPASQSGSFVIKAGEDRLVPDSIVIDPALQSDLITELQNELTSGGEKLTFEVDSSGNLVGKLPNGDVAVTVTLSGEQQGQDVKVTVTITQNVPLDHNGSDGMGYITSANDDIHINVPVQATDTDGDDLDTAANVDITITDGANPSFGADSGVTINESTDKGDVISGQIPLDVGSDAIHTIVFQADQPGLAGITSNGLPTTFTATGDTLTVLDSAGDTVMTVTVDTDGSYKVTVTGPIDQSDSESTNIDLNVTATDKDGDTTDGSLDITITDGDDASGSYNGTITLTEGDLDTDGNGVGGTDTSYPATQSGNFALTAGEDRLVPDSVEVDPAQVNALMAELTSELTSGGQALTFSLNADGDIVGMLGTEVALTVKLSAVQDGQDLTVTVDIAQNVPLDHNNTGDTTGYISSENDELHINVPVQAKDTDGDDLTTPATVGIILKDGDDPTFGTDTGVTINESSQQGDVISGQIPLDVGSDAIDTIVFQADQPSLTGITSNGQSTTYTVTGNTIMVVDSANNPVMTVTIATDGSYDVKVTGPIDQGNSESTNIDLNVTATDKDGDTTDGSMDITITDGTNATGGDQGALTLNEGDLDTAGDGVNPNDTDTSYPASQSGSFVIKAGEDSLVSGSVKIDPALQSDLITELQNELTSGGETLTFDVDGNGNLVGKLPNGDVAVTVILSGEQQGQDVKVTVTIEQNVPLDHNGSDGTGYITSASDVIHINVPVQATDTDGDDLDTPANVDITITDGANPSFGADSGVTINESTDKGNAIEGQIPLNVGSDEIATIVFQANQPELADLTSNGLPTTYAVTGSTITVYDSANKPVMTVTIDTDGSYKVTVTGPVEQNGASDSINIDLGVTATDKDGDTTNGSMDITITDGDDAAGGYSGTIELTEGDLDTDGNGVGGTDTSYPATKSGDFELTAGEDRLVPDSVEVDPAQVNALMVELAAELTSGGQALTFSLNADGDIVGRLNGQVALTVELSAAQNGQDLTVTVDITQNVPLDHKNTGNTAGYITSENDEIHINVPVQAKDTDGDDLTTAATVGIIIKDGDDPSFGTDAGTIVNETLNKGVPVEGQLNLDVGSDAIATLVFAQTQSDLEDLTSNGSPTTYDVTENTITLYDSNEKPIMVFTVDTDGKYTVTVTGPIDQDASLSTDLNLGVTATDKDGDSASGSMNVSITDGVNASGGETASVEITEPDLSPNGYPVSAETDITLNAGEDRLDVTTVGIDATQQAALISELEAELTSGGETLAFTLENGVLVGKLPNGAIAVSVTVTAVQAGQDVTVTVKVDQLLPLDHNASGNSTGYVSENGDSIAINIPLQGKDTDGDSLDNPAVVTVTIKDGQLPSFGVDTGISLNEETQEGLVISGSIAVDTGSDAIASIEFDDANMQSGFNGVTSNGHATTVEVSGNVLLLKDSDGKTVLEVTINNDGSYTAKITGELDQDINNLLNLPIKVTVTDGDGDTASGTINIEVADGSDATGGESLAMTAVEGDLETSTGGTTYPKTTSDSFMVTAGEDRLDPTTVNVDPVKVAALITELESELTSGGENLVFLLSADGSTLVGTTTPGGDVAVTITLSGTQVGDDINVNVEFKQHLPLDHNNPTDADGFVKTNGDDITISVPVQAKDTDGDDLDTAAKVDITIQDGADPVFGLDGGTTITETENSQTVSGAIDLDIGSDAIDKVEFDAVQASLVSLTTNGQATTYTVNGNVITVTIDGGINNGAPVLTITMNKDGTYTVKQDEPLDQDNTQGDDIGLTLGVVATDKDGDVSNSGQVIITIKDGQDATGENVTANLTVVEGDLENPATGKAYPSTGSGSFTVEAVNDNLVSNTMRVEADVQTDLLAELNGMTSNGAPLTFTLTVDANGVITITGMTQTGSTEILEITLTPTQLANGDVSVAMAIEQSGPLDHTNGSGTYVNVGDDAITVDIPVQMTDSDGDDLEKPVNVNVTITDGDDPKFGADSIVNLEEGDDGVVSGTGQIDVDTGSDDVVKVYFDDTQSSLNGLTSNGEATTYTVSADGSMIIVTLVSDPNVVVMEATVDIDGNYTVDQKQPIDQVDDKAGDNENIVLDVLADDKDGDTSAPGHINVVVIDGTNAGGGQTDAITITEGDLTPEGTESPYPVTGSTTINIPAGVDRLDPNSAEIDSNTLTGLITELQNELTAGGQPITFTYNTNTSTLTGMAAGVVVMTVVVDAVQAANDHDVDITITITQNQPLDHQGGNAGGMVSTDGDKITIDVPVQVADTDGDKLDTGISVDVTINDGTDPVITKVENLNVEESDINGNKNQGIHTGSTPSGKNGKSESDSGQITVDSGSDEVVDFKVDVDAFNANNTITSAGNSVSLIDAGNGLYQGMANGNVVFEFQLNADGSYEFEIKGPIDHSIQGKDSITIDIPVYAVDQDGDTSENVDMSVDVLDDIPSVKDKNITITEGDNSDKVDVLNGKGEGADGAKVTSVIIDGVEHTVSGNRFNNNAFKVYDDSTPKQELGTVYIKANGQVKFEANPDLDHDIEKIIETITVNVTDGDGDTASGEVKITINDKDATLTTHNSEGKEDNNSHSDMFDSDYHGIAINMDINVGDSDRGESVGTVTITLAGEMHGDFMWNGVVITPNADGSITLPIGAFTDSNNDGIFTIDGVTFMPDEDFSTIKGDLNFNVSAEVVNTDGSKHPGMNGSFIVHVDGVADIPTWDNSNTTYHYEVTEDTDNVDLNLTAVLQDDDGANTSSEELYYFITIKEGQGTLVGTGLVETSPNSGIYKVVAADIGSVQVDPANNFSGDIKLDVWAQSQEKDNGDTADSEVKEIIINVNPDADNATLKVKRVESDEDEKIDLKHHITFTSLDDNLDTSESLFLRISGLPTAAVLLVGGHALTAVNGVYEIPYEDLDTLQLKPTPESNVDFMIKVEGVIKDTATVTNPDGTTTTDVVNEFVTGEQTIEVDLTGVADAPDFDFNNSSWTELTDGRTGLETTIDEDGSAVFDFSVISGEHALAPTDNSETLSLVISNIPEGVKIFDAKGHEQALVYVGTDVNGNPKYEVNLSTLHGITITPPLNSTKDIDLNVRLVVTENDGDSEAFDGNLVIHVEPVVDATDYSKNSNGQEDSYVNLNWQPDLTDSKEVITGLVIKDLPADYDLYIGNTLITSGGGDITLTPAQVAQITSGGQSLRVKGPEDSDVDLTLKTEVTVTEMDVDSAATDVKNIEGTLNVNINAVVEDDGRLAIVDNNGDVTNKITSDANGVIDININTTGDQTFTNGLSFIEDDLSSTEVIEKVIITLVDADGNAITDQDIMDQFLVMGGINNGDGSWTVPQSELGNLQIIATESQTSTVYIHISAEIRDLGDNNEGDSSNGVRKDIDTVIELDFNGTTGGDQEAGNIDVQPDIVITGTEDNHLNFGNQLDAFISVSIAGSHHENDVFTLVIDASTLPNGVSITGAEYNYETGEYVLKVPVDSEGHVDLSAVGIKLPEDFAGDFELDVKYVTTDTVSGDVKEVTDIIPVQVNPVVDIPGNSQTGNHTPEVEISVVKTDGLDGNKQPISDGSADHDYTGIAYEDGDITLDLSVVLADRSTSLNEGLETVTSVTLTVDLTKGFFVAADGSLVSEITLPASELSNIQFRPVEDFSGSVSVGVKVDITDTAHFDQTGGSATDTGSYTTDVSFEVVAVNDAVNWTGTDKVVVGQEDAGGVSLAGIGGTIVDVDGSEQILSIKLTGVPEGFIIEGAVNNSNGEWSISLPSGQTTFNLDNIKVIPPEDFSGEVELNVVVYSKEDSLTEVAENSTSITIDVQPVADRVDTDVETKASGTENDTAGIDLILNIEAFDDQNSYDGSALNVKENGPEGLQITLTNVPESSSIALPDGVAGTATNMGGGVWIVTVESSDLDKLIFHPGDANTANSANWDGNIEVDIRAVDNGVVAEDSIAVDEIIHVDVEAENDAPVNVFPSNLIADEDVPLLINNLKVTDVDANETANSEMTVTLNVGDGTLNVPDSFDWAALGLQVTGEESDTLIISGSLDGINALLASGVEYTGDTNFNGDDTLTMTTNDQANSGTGPAEGLTDSDSITITVNPVNDAPVNTVPNAVTAEEDGSTVITGMQISDVDFGEAGTTGSMSVTLNVAHGILSVDIPVGSSVVVASQGTDTVVITGSMDDINALLNNGVTYEGDDNYSGADELTMTTHDGGNVGSGTDDTAISKVPVTVTPKADAPTLSLDNSFIQTAAIRGSLGTMIPLLGLIAVLTDTDGSETLSIMIKNLAGADLVNSNGDVIAGNQGNGTWIITKEDLADLNVIGLPEGGNNLKVVAVSEETDGSKAESATVDINVVVDNLANTGNQIGGSSSSDAANLVIDSSAEATLLGGDGNDILIGGAASDILVGGAGDDILWGGEQGGTGDGVEDIFKWQAGDFGIATNVATDTIMDFEVGIDKIDLTDAFSAYDSMSLTDLSSYIKLTGNGADSTLEIYDIQGDLVQNIVINGVSETALLGNDPTGMSDEDKISALLNCGQLDVANNFGDAGDNILVADNSGENLYGFDGNDVLTGGAGNDFLTGGNGNNLFTWDAALSNEDVITDFKLDQDQLDLSQILSDDGDDKFDMNDLLGHVTSGDLTASFDNDGKVNLSVTNSDSGDTQSIVLENIDSASLGDVSQADILNQLFSHDAFKVDPNL